MTEEAGDLAKEIKEDVLKMGNPPCPIARRRRFRSSLGSRITLWWT
jgi:hypothetical protein